jgi:hypothetical protein
LNRAAETEASAPAIPVGGANARYASISSTSRDSSLQPEQGASWSQGAAHFGHEDWGVRMRGTARARRSKKGGSGRESRAQKRNDGCFLRPSNSLTVEQSRLPNFLTLPRGAASRRSPSRRSPGAGHGQLFRTHSAHARRRATEGKKRQRQQRRGSLTCCEKNEVS